MSQQDKHSSCSAIFRTLKQLAFRNLIAVGAAYDTIEGVIAASNLCVPAVGAAAEFFSGGHFFFSALLLFSCNSPTCRKPVWFSFPFLQKRTLTKKTVIAIFSYAVWGTSVFLPAELPPSCVREARGGLRAGWVSTLCTDDADR